MRFFPLISSLIFFLFPLAFAQQVPPSSIIGTIVNKETGNPVYRASITVIGSTFGTSADTTGRFVIKGLPPGSYEVRVSAVGFAPVIVRGVLIHASQTSEITVPLVEQNVQMPEVVTMGGQQIDLPELPVSTRYLDYREIQHTAGAFDDVQRTITILPGVAQTRIDRNDLSIRGGSASENLHLIDGFEIDNINHFGTQGSGGGTTTFLNLDFVENSFFSGGGFGVRYGDKLSSVLSIDMRNGRTDRLRSKATLSATQVGLNFDGPVTENGSFLFSARRSYLDPIFKLYGYAFTPYFYDFLGKAVYQFGRADKIEVLGIGVIDRITRFDETQKQREDNDRTVLGSQTRAVAGLTWRHGFDHGIISVAAWQTYSDFTYGLVGVPKKVRPLVSDTSSEREISLKLDAIIQVFPSTEMSMGFGAKTARLKSKIYISSFRPGYTEDNKVSSMDIRSDTNGYKFSGYAQVSQTLGIFILTAGVRGDYFSMIREQLVVAPRFSVSVSVMPMTKLNIGIGRYYQSPSYIWLVTNPYNRALTHMGMNQYVLGVEHFVQSDLSVTLEGYIKKYDHYPVSLTRPYVVMVNSGAEIEAIDDAYTSFGLDYLESSGTGESRGIELFVQKKISDTPLYGRLSITYSDTRFIALDGVRRPSSFDQRWKITVSGGYSLDENWEFNTAFRFATGRPYTPFGEKNGLIWFYRSRDSYNTARVRANHSLDLRITRRWVTGSFIINTFIDIQNIYNRKPQEPPRWNLATMTPEETPTLGIVPSLGVSIEF